MVHWHTIYIAKPKVNVPEDYAILSLGIEKTYSQTRRRHGYQAYIIPVIDQGGSFLISYNTTCLVQDPP
jgi:hypothetical protein